MQRKLSDSSALLVGIPPSPTTRLNPGKHFFSFLYLRRPIITAQYLLNHCRPSTFCKRLSLQKSLPFSLLILAAG